MVRMLTPRIATLGTRIRLCERPSQARVYDADWRALVAHLIEVRGRQCEGVLDDGTPCGRTRCRIFGDHIEEVRDNPERRLDETNVQLLCGSCHTIKTNRVRLARMNGDIPDN